MFTWETMSSLLNNPNNFLSVKEPVVIMNEIMSWLFKDIQLTVAWLNLTMPNQTVQNGLKAKKIKFPHMNLFLEKQRIKFSCTYWPLSFCKILKKFLGLIQSYEDVPFLGPKRSYCPKLFFLKIINIILIYLLAPFTVQNFKIIPVDPPELLGCTIFGPKMTHFHKWEIISENLLMSFVSFIQAYLHAKNQSQI